MKKKTPHPKMNSASPVDKCLDIFKQLGEITRSLGPWCSYKAAGVFQEDIERRRLLIYDEEEQLLLCFVWTQLEVLRKRFEALVRSEYGHIENVTLVEPYISYKVFRLMDILLKSKNESATNQTDLCAIIFTQKRVTAVVLSDVINDFVKNNFDDFEGIWSDYILGHNVGSEIRLSDSSMSSKTQEQILKRFRQQEFNVLVSTSVIEEGLDVRKCNLVVKFDGVLSYREYAQSKGRARAKPSRFIIMAEEEKEREQRINLKVMREIEILLQEKCHNREIPDEEESEEFLHLSDRAIPPVFSNGDPSPRLTKDNAIQMLHMYCDKLYSDRYSSNKPTFSFRKVYSRHLAQEKYFFATVVLPATCPLAGKIEGDVMETQKLAKKSAAMKACIKLREIGELDERFLAKKIDLSDSEDEGEDGVLDDGSRENETSTYQQKIPDCFTGRKRLPTKGLYLYCINMKLIQAIENDVMTYFKQLMGNENRQAFGLLLANPMPEIPSFPIFTIAGIVHVDVKFLRKNVSVTRETMRKIFSFHEYIFGEFCHVFSKGKHFKQVASLNLLVFPVTNEAVRALNHDKVIMSPIIDMKIVKQALRPETQESEQGNGVLDFDNCVIDTPYRPIRSRAKYFVLGVLDHVTPSSSMGTKTFIDHYKERYNIDLNPEGTLLSALRSSLGSKYLIPRQEMGLCNSISSCPKKSRKLNKRREILPFEVCCIVPLPANLVFQSTCLPSAIHRIVSLLLAAELESEIKHSLRVTDDNAGSKRIRPLADVYESKGVCDNCFKTIESEEENCAFLDAPENLSRFMAEDGETGEIPCVKSKRHHLQKKDSELECLSRDGQKIQRSIHENELNHLIHKIGKFRLQMPDTCQFLTVLTTSTANAGFDLERFEFLGDSFLKLMVSIDVFCTFSCIDEGRLSQLRKKQVNNKHLMKIALTKRIHEKLNHMPLAERMWNPPHYIGDKDKAFHEIKTPHQNEDRSFYFVSQKIPQKRLADSIEALIGAFVDTGGCLSGLKVMEWLKLLPKKSHNNNTESLYCYWENIYSKPAVNINSEAVSQIYEGAKFSNLEASIDYTFKDKSLLVEAFTHTSYQRSDSTGCYQRLEFLGDALLDFLVSYLTYSGLSHISPGRMTDLRSALVNNNTFGLLSLKKDLHKYLQHHSPLLFGDVGSFCTELQYSNYSIDRHLENTFIIVTSEDGEGSHVPKVLGDIFESLAGAVFLDSNMDIETVWRVYSPFLAPLLISYSEKMPLNPYRELLELRPKASSRFHTDNDGKTVCTITVHNEVFKGTGKNKASAKLSAANVALDSLQSREERTNYTGD